MKLGRLALRVEGDFWNAYFARTDTMEGAILLGSIRMSLAKDKSVADAFKEVMKKGYAVQIEALTGHSPDWTERKAPDGERTHS